MEIENFDLMIIALIELTLIKKILTKIDYEMLVTIVLKCQIHDRQIVIIIRSEMPAMKVKRPHVLLLLQYYVRHECVYLSQIIVQIKDDEI